MNSPNVSKEMVMKERGTNTLNTSAISDYHESDEWKLFKLIMEREQKIKTLKEEDPKRNAQEIAVLSGELRGDYRKLIVHHTHFIFKEKKDADTQMWKNCFYKQIEDFRRSIRKNTAELATYADTDLRIEKQRYYLVQLTSALLNFLSDSTVFYQDMMIELETRIQQMVDLDVEIMIKCVYRCLLFLGDLARYREMYSENTNKSFLEAERYYERAALMFSNSGNAQNQLAVLATYSDAEFVAIYHYCRSIMVEHPFTGGFENLMTMFSKNAVAYAALKKQKVLFDPVLPVSVGSSRKMDKPKKMDNSKLKSFLTKFIRLHGLLFDWSTQMHRYYSQVDSSSSSTLSYAAFSHLKLNSSAAQPEGFGSEDINVDMYITLLHNVLEEYDQQLAQSSLSDQILVKLVAICVFSVHYGSERSNNILLHNTTLENRHHIATRSTPESLALITLFGIINRTSTRITTVMASSEKGRKSAMNKLLPMLSVFSEWASVHSHYMVTFDGATGRENISSSFMSENSHTLPPAIVSSISQQFEVSRDLLRSEVRARSGTRTALSSLTAIFEEDMNRSEFANITEEALYEHTQSQFLREHIELKGFLPLTEIYEKHFREFDPLSKAVPPVPEPLARFCRENVITKFIEMSRSIAAKESQDSNALRQQQIKEKAEAAAVNVSASAQKKSQQQKDSGGGSGRHGRERNKERDRERNRRREDHAVSAAAQPERRRRGPPAGVVDSEDNDDTSNQLDLHHAVASSGLSLEHEFPPLPGTLSSTTKANVNIDSAVVSELSFMQALASSGLEVNQKPRDTLSDGTLLDETSAVDYSNRYAVAESVPETLHDSSELSLTQYNTSMRMDEPFIRQPPALIPVAQHHLNLQQQQKQHQTVAASFHDDEEDLDEMVVFRPTVSRALHNTNPVMLSSFHPSTPELYANSPPLSQPPPLLSPVGGHSKAVTEDIFASLGIHRSGGGGVSAGMFSTSNNNSNNNLDNEWQPWGMSSQVNSVNSSAVFDTENSDRLITHPNSNSTSTNKLSEMFPAEPFRGFWDSNNGGANNTLMPTQQSFRPSEFDLLYSSSEYPLNGNLNNGISYSDMPAVTSHYSIGDYTHNNSNSYIFDGSATAVDSSSNASFIAYPPPGLSSAVSRPPGFTSPNSNRLPPLPPLTAVSNSTLVDSFDLYNTNSSNKSYLSTGKNT